MKEAEKNIRDDPGLYNDLRNFLALERDLFGDVVLMDHPIPEKAHMIPASLTGETIPLFDTPRGAGRPMESWEQAPSLAELNKQICLCVKCPLGHTRTKFVFGVGNPSASFMVIGEAPGADEDAQGEPFVGRAGQLLNKILEAINFRREDVYIANILKCRPPGNRKPVPEEVDLCLPYLKKQISLIAPKVILCLGLTAAENLLGTRESMSKLRGVIHSFEGVPVLVTYHPAALLRNPNWKRPTWEDVQAARKLHDERLNAFPR